jgi:hypothetical protein
MLFTFSYLVTHRHIIHPVKLIKLMSKKQILFAQVCTVYTRLLPLFVLLVITTKVKLLVNIIRHLVAKIAQREQRPWLDQLHVGSGASSS